MSFLTPEELTSLGFAACGKNVSIDRGARFFGTSRIAIGDNVRVDCFSMISAGAKGIVMGSHIHISSGVYIYGSGDHVSLCDFCGLSPGSKIFTATDDFSAGYLRGPQIPDEYRRLTTGAVSIGENSQVGASSIILPGVELGRNSSVGALSLVTQSVAANSVVAGIPARQISTRDGELADRLMSKFLQTWNSLE